MNVIRTTVALISVLIAASSARAQGLDVTGTWTGKGSCSGLVAGAKQRASGTVSLALTDDVASNAVASSLQLQGTGSSAGFVLALFGCGFAEPLPGHANKGRAALHGLNFLSPFEQFFTANVSSIKTFAPDKKGRTGKLTVSYTVGDKSQDVILTCKVHVHRTDQTDPNVLACDNPV
jgi:hypothetical protein